MVLPGPGRILAQQGSLWSGYNHLNIWSDLPILEDLRFLTTGKKSGVGSCKAGLDSTASSWEKFEVRGFLWLCVSTLRSVCLFKFWPRSPAPQSRKAVSDWPLGVYSEIIRLFFPPRSTQAWYRTRSVPAHTKCAGPTQGRFLVGTYLRHPV